nr:hypothetical protein [Tanacetum cinerariifolium]
MPPTMTTRNNGGRTATSRGRRTGGEIGRGGGRTGDQGGRGDGRGNRANGGVDCNTTKIRNAAKYNLWGAT